MLTFYLHLINKLLTAMYYNFFMLHCSYVLALKKPSFYRIDFKTKSK